MTGVTDNTLLNGKLSAYMIHNFGFGQVGCAWRGSPICHDCPFADQVARICDYKCWRCPDRAGCPCGQDGQDQVVDLLLEKENETL